MVTNDLRLWINETHTQQQRNNESTDTGICTEHLQKMLTASAKSAVINRQIYVPSSSVCFNGEFFGSC